MLQSRKRSKSKSLQESAKKRKSIAIDSGWEWYGG
jgi:hypothetical protein